MKNILEKYDVELQYSFFISGLGFIWLMGEYVSGLQDIHVVYYPLVAPLALLIPVVFLFLALLKRRNELDGIISFGEGFKSGLIITVICAVMTVPVQLIFHYMINPKYFDVMIDESVYRAVDKGLDEAKATDMAVAYFNVKSFLIQGFSVTILIGTFLSLIYAWIIKRTMKPGERAEEIHADIPERLNETLPK